MASTPAHRARTLSVSSNATSTNGKRRRADMDAELDTKTFKMSDLIVWRPKAENELRKKWDEKKQQMLENMSNASAANGGGSLPPKQTATGPRVKLNEKGQIVIDQESLVVTETPENNIWQTVDDDLMPKKLNSMSFRRRTQRSSLWTDLETDMFYHVLSATGPDFGLMHEFIPNRSRTELKKKFTREERENSLRVDETLRKPSMLNKGLYSKCKDWMKEIEDEKTLKEEAKKKKNSKDSDTDKEEAENDEQSDVAAPVPEVVVKEKKARKPRKKKETRKDSEKENEVEVSAEEGAQDKETEGYSESADPKKNEKKPRNPRKSKKAEQDNETEAPVIPDEPASEKSEEVVPKKKGRKKKVDTNEYRPVAKMSKNQIGAVLEMAAKTVRKTRRQQKIEEALAERVNPSPQQTLPESVNQGPPTNGLNVEEGSVNRGAQT